MPLTDCMTLWNMVAAEYGLRSRLGYRQWAVGLTGAADNQIRSHIPFHGTTGAANKLFVTTSSGIWNVTAQGGVTSAWAGDTAYAQGVFVTSNSNTFGCRTAGTSASSGGLPGTWAATTAYVEDDRVINGASVYICTTAGTSAGSGGPTGTGTSITDGTAVWDYQSESSEISDGTASWKYHASLTAPSLAIAFADTSGLAGYGECVTMVTSAGHFGVYCDEVNGYYVYTESSGAWAKVALGAGATEVSGVNPANFVFPFVHNNRLYFVERDTAKVWYLGLNSVYGAASSLNLAGRFRAGGYLVGLWNWTGDGGAGVDDKIVAVSSGGDIVIYEITDPTIATGIRVSGVWDAGGVPTGRRFASKNGGDVLVATKQGLLPMSRLVLGSSTIDGTQYESRKISNLFAQLMTSKSGIRGWSLHIHPEDATLLVTVPTQTDAETEQLAMSIASKSWSRYSDLPMFSAGVWDGKLYFGDADGNVYVNDGYLDNVLLADTNIYTDITWRVLTAFNSNGNARMKQVQTIVPTFYSDGGVPSYAIEARYRFDLTEIGAVTVGSVGGNNWDSGLWDTATWSGDYAPTQAVSGAAGMGRQFAIAIKGRSRARTILTGIDVTFTQGGPL